jgi:phosphoglycolate phosphatase-like HAD superfamily hydrolase
MEKSWNEVNRKYMLNHPFDEYFSYVGLPFLEIMINMGISDDVYNIKDDYFKFTKKNQHLIKPYQGASEIFSVLGQRKIATGIITSKEKSNSISICSNFGLLPDEIITPNDVANGKPSADSGIEYLLRSGFKESDILYVGDMESDYQFSLNIGFDFVHARYGYGNIKADNMIIIDNLLDIVDII